MNSFRYLIEIIRKKEIIGFFMALCLSYLVFPNFYYRGIYPVSNLEATWASLDPSWILTLSKVNIDNLVWGKDFVFTYGPLSYLSTRVGLGVSKYQFILFDLFIAFNFFCLFYNSYVKSSNRALTATLCIVTCILLPAYFGSGNALVLSAFLIFWIRESLEKNRPFFYAMQLTILLLLFFIKFNTGLISFVFVFLGLVYQVIVNKQSKLLIAAYAILPVILVPALCGYFNVALWPYLTGGLNAISGYNEIMYLDEKHVDEFRYAVLFVVLSVFVVLFKTYHERQNRQDLLKNLLICFLFSVSIFILYKQGFVRADFPHIQEFYKYGTIFILCIRDFHFREIGKYSKSIVVFLMFLALFFAKRNDNNLLNITNRMFKPEYTNGYSNYSDTAGMFLFPTKNAIPQAIKDKIGKKTTDVYPWNTLMLFENKMNYFPRPAFQSYTAYTPYLENLNFEFYNSAAAPNYVFYDYDAIDGRYPLFDETKVNLTLLRNYSCMDTFLFGNRLILVLEKKKTAKSIKFEKIKEFEIWMYDGIEPQPDSYYELYVSNTMKGKLISTLKYAPEMYLIVNTKDQRRREYRTSKKLLETGIFSNYFFGSTRDFYKRMNNDTLRPENEIENYRLRTLDSSNTLFKNRIKVIEYKIKQ